jgi:hypothetical protein
LLDDHEVDRLDEGEQPEQDRQVRHRPLVGTADEVGEADAPVDQVHEQGQGDGADEHPAEPGGHQVPERQLEQVIADVSAQLGHLDPGRATLAEQQPYLPLRSDPTGLPQGEEHRSGHGQPCVGGTHLGLVPLQDAALGSIDLGCASMIG